MLQAQFWAWKLKELQNINKQVNNSMEKWTKKNNEQLKKHIDEF